jgi:hypothetical protein
MTWLADAQTYGTIFRIRRYRRKELFQTLKGIRLKARKQWIHQTVIVLRNVAD